MSLREIIFGCKKPENDINEKLRKEYEEKCETITELHEIKKKILTNPLGFIEDEFFNIGNVILACCDMVGMLSFKQMEKRTEIFEEVKKLLKRQLDEDYIMNHQFEISAKLEIDIMNARLRKYTTSEEIPTQMVYFDKKIGYPIKLSQLLTEDQRHRAYALAIKFNKLVEEIDSENREDRFKEVIIECKEFDKVKP